MKEYGEDEKRLVWKVDEPVSILKTPVFELLKQTETATNGVTGDYITMKAPDWVMTIPVIGDDFVLVKQWRHSLKDITMEFPGGVADSGEKMMQSALRELEEETGYRAHRIIKIGECNPNPALFQNTFHIFLADELEGTGIQHLDHDEMIDIVRVPIRQVIAEYGDGYYKHGLMGTALAFYMRHALL